MAAKNTKDKTFLATMSTEHFSFYAVGKTLEEAKRAVAKKFNELAPEKMTVAELEDWYGIWAFPMSAGEAVRI